MEIAMYEVSVWIGGAGFDARAFQREFGQSLGGVALSVKFISEGALGYRDGGWKSKVATTEYEGIEPILRSLLGELAPALRVARSCDASIVAQVVLVVADRIQASGLYISREIVAALNDAGASLDFDISLRQK